MVINIAFDFKKQKQRAAKMSRYIREKKQIGDYHFITVIHTANSATTSSLSNP